MRHVIFALLVATITALVPVKVSAQGRVSDMLSDCQFEAAKRLGGDVANTTAKYEGQRVDGTHAVNGTIALRSATARFQCSFAANGYDLVAFWTNGSQAQRPPRGGGTTSTDIVEVTGVAANDVLNVRSGPGPNNRIVGALSNGTKVRMLRCRMSGDSRWCRIEMMTDMRERGWVNARYLTGSIGAAVQRPAPAPQAPVASGTRTERVRFDTGTNSAILTDVLSPGSSKRYVLGARNGQELLVRVAARGPGIFYQIFNPDNSFLLDQISSKREYRGQLWQTGDHVIEVINRGNSNTSYNVIFGID